MMITEICTGCGACKESCPAKCIKMLENKFGEYSPIIDLDKCLHCDLCKTSCPQNNAPSFEEPQMCYVAWSKKEEDRTESASGGIAATFLRMCISLGWASYGCDYNDSFEMQHFKVDSESDIERARSSKYSQSNAFVVFKEIEEFLKNEQKVLFIGTPCQVAGLIKYLRKEYPLLITVDLVCHGTPPTKYLREHLRSLHLLDKAKRVRFRGIYDQFLAVWGNDGLLYKRHWDEDRYFKAFYANEISRESCYSCKYAQQKRISDITIGDFWGIGELKTIKEQSNRPSLILVNTNKGETFLEAMQQHLILEERSCEEGISGNGRLNSPPGKNRPAKYFRSLYPLVGFRGAIYGSALINKIIETVKKWH